MIADRMRTAIQNVATVAPIESISLTNPADWRIGRLYGADQRSAMKLSAVNCCVETISNTVAKIPTFVMDADRNHVGHALNPLLRYRVNEAMTRFAYEKLMESNRLLRGNAYALIVRDANYRPAELIPLPPDYVTIVFDDVGAQWYVFAHPKTGEVRRFPREDILHYKAYSEDGITGMSVLQRASDVISAARAAQDYEGKFYSQNAQIPGVLTVDTDLKRESKTKIREEWERIHSGIDNAYRIAILDNGLKYQPIGLTNKDAQFVESKSISIEDIGRFFGVPLYKLNAGKQSYSSNEQNAIEYLSGTIHPIISEREQEDSFKLLSDSELQQGLYIRRNMNAEMRGDFAARGAWYTAQRTNGVFSVNDIRALEDMPDVPGGDVRLASLNYVPLQDFERLSDSRNGGNATV